MCNYLTALVFWQADDIHKHVLFIANLFRDNKVFMHVLLPLNAFLPWDYSATLIHEINVNNLETILRV